MNGKLSSQELQITEYMDKIAVLEDEVKKVSICQHPDLLLNEQKSSRCILI